MKYLLIPFILLSSCEHPKETVVQSSNPDYDVVLLFTNNGCNVYRFAVNDNKNGDHTPHFYTDCKGSTSQTIQIGKTTRVEDIQTSR